jgi:uncharacterized protein YfcZ (UPF0381/DUF406 family)
MEKTNIEHLKDILTEINKTHGIDISEAEEFIEAAGKELTDAQDKITSLKEYLRDAESEDCDCDEEVYENSDFVGLDTISWSLKNGNLSIQQDMENFILRLKHKNCVSA